MPTSKLVQGINRIFHEYMVTDTMEQLGAVCLSVTEELTGSKFGFIGEIKPEGRLDDLALNHISYDDCLLSVLSGHGKLPNNLPVKGLYGRVLEEGKSLVANDPEHHPHSDGTPPGHPRLNNFLGVPLNYQGKTIGILALANREGGYRSEEVRIAEALAPAIIEVLMRKRAEEELTRHRDHLEQLVAERTRELRDLAHRLVDAQEQERAVIGISLHDEIGQLLTYATLLIDKATRKPDAKILEEAKTTVQEAISRIRDLSSMLSPNLLRSAGLGHAVGSLVDDFTRRTRVKVDVRFSGEISSDIPEEAALACYRIVQESLTNIIRHAKAMEVKVHLSRLQNAIRIDVEDNGVGFEPERMKKTTGLTGMRERALALGGEFNIESIPGKGTHINALIPLSERKQS